MVRERGELAVKTPADLVALGPQGSQRSDVHAGSMLDIWDGEDWTAVKAITATRRTAKRS